MYNIGIAVGGSRAFSVPVIPVIVAICVIVYLFAKKRRKVQ